MNDSNEALVVVGLGSILEGLTARENKILVTDQASYTLAANFLIEAKSYVKDVGSKLDPGINSAKTHLDFLKNQKSGYVDPVKRLIEMVQTRAENWRAEEKRLALLEQEREQAKLRAEAQRKADEERRIAEAQAAERRKEQLAEAARQLKIREKEIEEARKAGEMSKKAAAMAARMAEDEAILSKKRADEEAAAARKLAQEHAAKSAENVTVVRVAPSVPVIAGVKNQTYYGADVIDKSAIIDRFALALMTKNNDQAVFLRKFIIVDEAAVSKFARDTKDSAKVESLLPGVRATSRG